MEVSWNGGTPKSSILIYFSTINHPFGGYLHLWKPPHVLRLVMVQFHTEIQLPASSQALLNGLMFSRSYKEATKETHRLRWGFLIFWFSRSHSQMADSACTKYAPTVMNILTYVKQVRIWCWIWLHFFSPYGVDCLVKSLLLRFYPTWLKKPCGSSARESDPRNPRSEVEPWGNTTQMAGETAMIWVAKIIKDRVYHQQNMEIYGDITIIIYNQLYIYILCVADV